MEGLPSGFYLGDFLLGDFLFATVGKRNRYDRKEVVPGSLELMNDVQ